MLKFAFKKNLLAYFFVFILLPNITSAQKIKKIIDSNLFELADGRMIKLAGVDAPNINNKNISLQSIAVEAYKYAKERFAGKKFNLVFINSDKADSNYFLVSIIRKYPLLTLDFTEEYLTKGFGKFINNVNSSDSIKYKIAEQSAKGNKNGIWRITNLPDTLDQTFLGKELLNDKAIDSIKVAYVSHPFLNNLSTGDRIFIEVFASPVFGMLGGIAGIGAGSGVGYIAGVKDWGYLGYFLIGGYVGYLAGSSYGTYLVAKNGNRDITYGYSLLASLAGGVSGILLSSYFNGFKNDNFSSYAPFYLPVIASIVYANLIAPKIEQTQNSVSVNRNQIPIKNYFTHNDFYNSTKLININLFRINF